MEHILTYTPYIHSTTMPSRGDELLAKAEKKGSSSVGWFGSSSTKWEEAGDLFQQVSPSTNIPAGMEITNRRLMHTKLNRDGQSPDRLSRGSSELSRSWSTS
jgi:hypothetical protein